MSDPAKRALDEENPLTKIDPDTLRELSKMDYEAHGQETSERLKYQSEFAHAALRTLILVNGGAIISLFTFAGHARETLQEESIWWAFASFSAGLIFTMTAYIAAYFSQALFMNAAYARQLNAQRILAGLVPNFDPTGYHNRGTKVLIAGITSSLLGLSGFVAGAAFALNGIF